MRIGNTTDRIELYHRLVQNVQRRIMGLPAPSDSLSRLQRALGCYGPVHEVLEEADRRVFQLMGELSTGGTRDPRFLA